jgi:hypothetical protein
MLHALPVSADAAGVFTVSDRTEVRARYPDATTQPVGQDVALDLDTTLDARAVWAAHNATYTLADLPRLTLLDYNNRAGSQQAFLDTVQASAEWHPPHVLLRVAETASYGEQSFESLSALPAAGTSPVGNATGQSTTSPSVVPTTNQTILYASSVTSVASTLQLRPWAISARVGYQLSGGADQAAQKSLPLEQGPLATLSADWQVDRRDHLITVANGSETSFSQSAEDSQGAEDVLVKVDEQWRHRWSRRTETLLAGGWYVARSRVTAIAPDQFESGPDGEAAVNQQFDLGGGTGQFRADVSVAPFIDPLNGVLDEQIRGTLTGSWTRRRVTFRIFASAGESLDQDTSTSIRLAMAEIGTVYRVSEWLMVDGGVRALDQEQKGASPPSLTQGVLFLALTVRLARARF